LGGPAVVVIVVVAVVGIGAVGLEGVEVVEGSGVEEGEAAGVALDEEELSALVGVVVLVCWVVEWFFAGAADGHGGSGNGWGGAEGLESEGGPQVTVDGSDGARVVTLAGDFDIEESGFGVPEAAYAPGGGDDLFESHGFHFVGGEVVVEVGLGKGAEFLFGLVGEEDGQVAGEAVA